MDNKNKYQDGEKVIIKGEVFTISQWSYVAKMKRYSYTILEKPSTFYFEEELSKTEQK